MVELGYETAREFLFNEAELLDQRKFDAWFNLFTDDGWYWIPNDPDEHDPDNALSLIYDRGDQLRERVWRLNSSYAHAQTPSSRTTHLLSNIRVTNIGFDHLTVDSAFMVHEFRKGTRHLYSGRSRHELIRDTEKIMIQSKQVFLLDALAELGNVSFLF